MKRILHFPTNFYSLIAVFVMTAFCLTAEAQISQKGPVSLDKPNLWSDKDLIEPSDLASILRNKKSTKPVIFNIGVVEDIQGAKSLGASSNKENLEKLHAQLKSLPKTSAVVIYCGCCPFDKCPNIRPAFTMMKDMGFKNGKLLNLPVNLKQNWISKGYPMLSNQ